MRDMIRLELRLPLVPAKAGTHELNMLLWIPAYAGMSGVC
jgi:hypothetical protein